MKARERILQTWKSFKKELLLDWNFLGELSDNLSTMAFVSATVLTKKSPHQVLAELAEKMPSISQNCQQLRNKFLNNQFGQKSSINVWMIYITYTDLVETYQRIAEYYNQNQSGPTIEEIDNNPSVIYRLKKAVNDPETPILKMAYSGNTITDLRSDLQATKREVEHWKRRFNTLKNLIDQLEVN